MSLAKKWLLGAVAVTLAALPAVAADWWYAVYEGEKHVGYCHVVESTATLGGVVVKRVTTVCEAKRDKAGQFTFKRTTDHYRGDTGVLYYSSTTQDKDTTTVVKATRSAAGFNVAVTVTPKGKEAKTEAIDVPAASFNMVEVEEALPKLEAVGRRVDALALDPETGKVSKAKLEYIADQTLDVGGASVATKAVQAKGGFGGTTFWFDADGVLVKSTGETPCGKGAMTRTDALSAQKVP